MFLKERPFPTSLDFTIAIKLSINIIVDNPAEIRQYKQNAFNTNACVYTNHRDIKNPTLDNPRSDIRNFLFFDLKYKTLKLNTKT